MGCELRNELASQYLAALDKVRRAQQGVDHAVTRTNVECATTELRRVEEYRLSVLHQLVDHCETHDCAGQEPEQVSQHQVRSDTRAVA